MHPYIAQINEVAEGSSRGIVRRWWKTHRLMLGASMVGLVASCVLMHEGFSLIGQIAMALSAVGFILPAVYFLVTLPVHLVLFFDPTDSREIAQYVFHHKAVVWGTHDPSLMEVFEHLKQVFEKADAQTRRDLIWLILTWETPPGVGDVQISRDDAKRMFDEMFPSTVQVEAGVEEETSGWRAFSKKYLRI